MPLEEVLKEIKQTSQEENEKVIEKAREEARALLAETQKSVDKLEAKAKARVEKDMDLLKKRELSTEKLNCNRELLNTKKELLEGVYVNAKKEIATASTTTRKKHLEQLFKKASKKLEGKTLYCNNADKAIMDKIAKGMNIKEIDCLGGFIIEDAAGEKRENLTFDTLIERTQEETLQKVSEELFK